MTKLMINVVAPIAGALGLVVLTGLLMMDPRWAYVGLPLVGGLFVLSSSYGYKGTSWGESCAEAGRVIGALTLIAAVMAYANWALS